MLNGSLIFLNFQSRFFNVPNRPVHNSIHIHRYRIFGQGLLCLKGAYSHTLVDIGRDTVNNRNNHEWTRTS